MSKRFFLVKSEMCLYQRSLLMIFFFFWVGGGGVDSWVQHFLLWSGLLHKHHGHNGFASH